MMPKIFCERFYQSKVVQHIIQDKQLKRKTGEKEKKKN